MPRRQREARPKVTLVDVQVGATEAARVHAQQKIFSQTDFSGVFELRKMRF